MEMQQQPAQVNMQPMQGTAQPMQPYQGNVQMGVPVVAQPVIVVAGGGGGPLPQVSDQQLAQMAKARRFRLENGQWKFIAPPNYVTYVLMGCILLFTFFPIIMCVISKMAFPLVGLIAPIIMLVALVFVWGDIQLTFDDTQQVVYHRSRGASCVAKETTIRYSDCISFNAVLRIHHHHGHNTHGSSHTSSHYAYSLTTLGGNYEIFSTQDNLEEASLNAFLRERLAAAGIQPQMPMNFVQQPQVQVPANFQQQQFVAPQPVAPQPAACAPAEL
eukprot:TRINITY_DN459_c0_g1_i3.p1 TRINITY_DN459_c0_g1~~TRINITY_DN459_c0_g1_i3.p1  ORF type:complete len:273 (+),score=40.28 TRINITY_DN459_c0_g1_i3:55-873(+)